MRFMRGFVLGVVAVVCGCVGSVNPVIDDRSATFDPALLGTWSDSAGKERAVITQGAPRTYAIQYTDDAGETVSFNGTLGRSGTRYILDVQPTSAALGPYKDLVVRLHIPVILDATSGRIHVATLDGDALDRFLRSNPGAVAHGRTSDGLVLTADTPGLERFFAGYLQRPGALMTPSTWIRRSP